MSNRLCFHVFRRTLSKKRRKVNIAVFGAPEAQNHGIYSVFWTAPSKNTGRTDSGFLQQLAYAVSSSVHGLLCRAPSLTRCSLLSAGVYVVWSSKHSVRKAISSICASEFLFVNAEVGGPLERGGRIRQMVALSVSRYCLKPMDSL